MKQRKSGYLFALGAALALSSSFIFSKSALNHISMLQFGAVWFTLGVLWNSAWYFGRQKYKNFKNNSRDRVGISSLVAILEAAATGLFYMAIREMENPAVVSFIGNIGPVFVTSMGITLLKEKFGKMQAMGILIAIAGVFVINFRDGAFSGFLDPGAVYVIIASFLFSLATISGRKYKEHLDPDLLSLIRAIMLGVVFCGLIIRSGESINFDWFIWRDLALGSLFETLITIVFAYEALKRIEATSTSLIISSKGVWALLLAWIFLNVFPSGTQIVGGVLTMIGIYFITWKRKTSSQE
jgi:drug/metabolite transporter (DMT)-like permease